MPSPIRHLATGLSRIPIPVRVWILNAVVAVAAIALLTPLAGAGSTRQTMLPWWALATAFAAAELCVVHVHFRRSSHSLTLGEIPLVVGLVFSTPIEVAVAWVVGSGFALALSRPQPVRWAFNLVNFALIAATAETVMQMVTGDRTGVGPLIWAGAALGAILASPLAALLVTCAMMLSGERLRLEKTVHMVAMGVVVAATNASLGLAIVAVLAADPRAALLLIAPAAALFLAYRAYTSQRAQHVSLEFLYEASRTFSQAHDVSSGLAGVLAMSLDTFRAEIAEVCILPLEEDGAGSRVTVGPDQQIRIMEEVDAGVVAQLRALLEADLHARVITADEIDGPLGAHLASTGVREAMFAALPGDGRLVGTMLVGNRLGVGSFEAEDRRLFETLAGHTGSSLGQDRLEQRVTELRETKDHLYHQAFHDPLTGLANRSLFTDRVQHALSRRGGNVVVLYIDLNDFKPVNDTYGHEAGDLLLCAVGDRLRESLREADTPARLGGDEFAVLLTDIAPADVHVVTDRIGRAFARPVALADGRFTNISASMGVAIADSGSSSAAELLRNADAAMYVTKRGDKRGVTVHEKPIAA